MCNLLETYTFKNNKCWIDLYQDTLRPKVILKELCKANYFFSCHSPAKMSIHT